MKCRLCLKERELKNSHIIPEFVFRLLYDSKHRFHVLSTLEKRLRPLQQKGIREPLLCGECEQKLSVYENYARGVLLGGIAVTVQDAGSLIRISDINYKKFKLFELSILWRASISSDSMFRRVSLGSHEEKIRKMLFESAPCGVLDYPCIILGIASSDGVASNFIDQPTKLHLDNHVAYRFIFAGFMWVFYVSSHKLPAQIKDIAVNESGEMVIYRGNFRDLKYLKDFGRESQKKGRMPMPTE